MATVINRTTKPLPPPPAVAAPRAAQPPPTMGTLDKIKEMIPGESTALYIGGFGVIPTGQAVAITVWALLGLLMTVLVKAQQKDPQTGQKVPKIEWNQVIVAAVAFVIWVYALGGGPFELFGLYVPWVGSLLILGYTAFSPWILAGLDKVLP